jgi:hypothetical protein
VEVVISRPQVAGSDNAKTKGKATRKKKANK